MRNPERIPVVLDEIKNLWKQHPDMRLGQLLYAMGTDFNVEDYDFLQSYSDRTKKYDVDTTKFPEYWIEPNGWKLLIPSKQKENPIVN